MTSDEKEMLNSLKDSINIESYNELVECFKINLNRFRYDLGSTIKSIDPIHFYQAGEILRELKTRVDLLLKLSDFIDYVGVLQGTLMKE
jgi:hypothetical protein